MAPRAPKPAREPEPATEEIVATEEVAAPEPEPFEEIVATEEVADEDVERYADAMAALPVDEDHSLTWPLETDVDYRVPYAARGKIATQLLNAAAELGYPVDAIRSQTDGFLVPSRVYFHLFPSQSPDEE
jgi:hypothetical protein